MAPPAAKPFAIPHFQSKDVEFWFLQLEALFRSNKVTDDQTRFDYVIQALDITAASSVRHILKSPPEEDRYEALKKALTDRLALSEAARIKQAMSNEALGDRKPSQHLRHLQDLAGDNLSDAALTSIWIEALPPNVKQIVAGSNLDLDDLAAMADRILDVTGHQRSVAAVATSNASNDPITTLSKQISALTKTVTRLVNKEKDGPSKPKQARVNSPTAAATASSGTSGSGSSASAPSNGLCWYHNRYAAAAKKCKQPCTWTGAAPSASNSGNGTGQQ